MMPNHIPTNINASLYNAWFRKEYPELFECEIKEYAESCEECGFCKMDGGGDAEVTPMTDCKWMKDEICCNADCPRCADYCPVANDPGVCRFEEREDGGAENDHREST